MSSLDLLAGRGAAPIVIELEQRAGQMCGCTSDRLCATCLEQNFARHRGVCACRADTWIGSLPASVRAKPWPGYTEKVAAIAMRWVADLGSDSRLLSLLAAEFASWAAKRWSKERS